MLVLKWITHDTDGNWCSLDHLDLSAIQETGVYIVWHAGDPSRVVRIGQGKIGVRLARQRADPKVHAYESFGLLVTWATAPLLQLDGIERYLADRWHPLVGGATPNAAPIAVNDPWTG